ncbi:hypothetical protein [Kitasatospora sp. NPDC088351]|uniref:hypothetical protein n=1 Tax=Kitasatospora sp. NPDC088351 TaxID=3155180 RepID=UPI00342A92D1
MDQQDQQDQTAPLGSGTEARRDREPDALLRRFGLGLRSRAWEVMRGVRPRTVLVLGLLSLGLLMGGLRTSPAAVFWAITGCWALALGVGFAVLCAFAEGRRSGR